ncbi:MAG TPA: serine/threonine-protein kinase, partial [Hyphomicrobiaceae bacterium]|nr:serine/threonine-protein kinase [Hyphomicrobiaceae bacterium]
DVCPRSQGSKDDYEWGLARFMDEARTLGQLKHPNIVVVHRYFKARNTGYIVQEYEDGVSFRLWLKSLGRAPRQQELDRILVPLLDALEAVHAADFLHRDIAPDNIIIRPDGSPVLIDFGSARKEVAKHSRNVSALVKPGYSPNEQYATDGRQQGPWTDIYALGATLYHAVTGKRPPDAPARIGTDPLVPVGDAALSSYRPDFLAAIDRALALDIGDRPQTVAEWRKALFAEPKSKRSRKEREKAAALTPALVDAGSMPLVAAAHAAASPPAPGLAAKLASARSPAVAPVAPKPARKGLLEEMREGWRNAAAPAVAKPPAVRAELPVKKKPEPPKLPRSDRPGVETAAAVAAAPSPAAQPRRPTPRALRRGPKARWFGLAAKLLAGVGIAGAAVALQDRLPEVKREGSGTVLSQTGERVPSAIKGHRGVVRGVGFTSDGLQIVSTAEDGTIRVWNAATRALVRSWALDNGSATAFAVDGRKAATGHRDGSVALWDIETGGRLATFKRQDHTAPGSVGSLAFAGEPGLIAVAQDRSAVLWDVRTPAAPVSTLEGPDSATRLIAYSARRGLLASAGGDHSIRLWKAQDGTLLRTWRGHGDPISAIAFAPDGNRIATASQDGEIRISSANLTRTHFKFRVAAGRITALAFSPSSQVLASAGEDGVVRLWDLKRGRPIRSFQSHTGGLQALGFSPDGRLLAAAGNDGAVRVWDATVVKSGS